LAFRIDSKSVEDKRTGEQQCSSREATPIPIS
jgi:hypothetical protein